MRILFLDDMQSRHDAFRRYSFGHDVTHVYTAADAIKALDSAPRFDIAQLDHDLAEEHYNADTEYGSGTGMDVVDHIVKMPADKRPLKVIAHTFNERGREMVLRLRDAGVKKSYWFRFNPNDVI